MKATKKPRREKLFPRTFPLKMSDHMYTEIRRSLGRQACAKIREMLISRYPSLNDKSSAQNQVITTNVPLFEATRMLAGSYASLRELQKHVCKCPTSALALVRADLSEALGIIETRIGRACDLLAKTGENSP
jgi:hypothetical protein